MLCVCGTRSNISASIVCLSTAWPLTRSFARVFVPIPYYIDIDIDIKNQIFQLSSLLILLIQEVYSQPREIQRIFIGVSVNVFVLRVSRKKRSKSVLKALPL